ncbi:MAG: RAMP superfamily CRISPR-associated protein [Anaerolineae bacterium]
MSGDAYAFRLRFKAVSPLLVREPGGAAKEQRALSADLPVGRRYLIPRSSWKGALRSTAESIAARVQLGSIAAAEHMRMIASTGAGRGGLLVYHDGGRLLGEAQSILQRVAPGSSVLEGRMLKDGLDAALAAVFAPDDRLQLDEAAHKVARALAHLTCPVCATFGSPYAAGLLNLSDSPFEGREVKLTHVSLARDTLTASENKLFSEVAVEPVGRVILLATLVVPERYGAGGIYSDGNEILDLWISVLREAADFGIRLGGGRSRGRGILMLDVKGSEYRTFASRGWSGLGDLIGTRRVGQA